MVKVIKMFTEGKYKWVLENSEGQWTDLVADTRLILNSKDTGLESLGDTIRFSVLMMPGRYTTENEYPMAMMTNHLTKVHTEDPLRLFLSEGQLTRLTFKSAIMPDGVVFGA